MKKISLLLMTAIMAVGLIACSNNDEPDNGGAQETTSGLYILNTGNMRSKIAPSITAYDFAIDTATPADQDAFYNANNFQLGEELQQAIVCNGKMYIAMYTSNMLWVVEPNTLKVITSIRFDGDAKSPAISRRKTERYIAPCIPATYARSTPRPTKSLAL